MMRRVASPVLMPVFFWLWVSLAETPMQNISTPQARPRSRPFSFSTRPERVTPAGLFPAKCRNRSVGVGHLRHLRGGRTSRPGGCRRRRRTVPRSSGSSPPVGRPSARHLQAVARPDLVDDDFVHKQLLINQCLKAWRRRLAPSRAWYSTRPCRRCGPCPP